MSKIAVLPAGQVITVTGPAHAVQIEDSSVGAIVAPQGTRTFGPYLVDRTFKIDGGSWAIAAGALSLQLAGALLLNSGAPASAVRAALTVNPAGDDNALTFTARAYGTDGNRITVAYTDPGANDAALAVRVSEQTIVVSLATGVAGAITSTAAEVKAGIEASAAANALVTAAIYAADSGVADDGSGIVTAMAATALADGAGTGIGAALPGAACIDTTNGLRYSNTGTLAAPTWAADVTTATYAATASTVNALAALHLYGAGVPVDYTDGTPPATGEGTAPKGAIYSDTTNGFVYRNSGTQAQPIWTKLGDAVV